MESVITPATHSRCSWFLISQRSFVDIKIISCRNKEFCSQMIFLLSDADAGSRPLIVDIWRHQI